ncbi:MAG: hypothetical protein CSA86_01100 [Arcobacter sp.]|nr:MAG: hypothetical protein CSA86_01100 [Arcobacter sp.]
MKYVFLILSLISFIIAGEYEKDHSIVIDTKYKLMWQDDIEVMEYLETFITAKVYCETLSLRGFQDWRVPNIYELLKIVDVTQKNAINKKFKYLKPNFYSTSSVFQKNNNFIFGVDFKTGAIKMDKKTNNNYIRCVRDIL